MSDWLVYYGEDEAVFRKPYSRRILSVIFLVIMTCFLGFSTVETYKGGAAQRDYLPLNFIALFVFLLILGLGAGPNEMRFDFRRRRYQSKMGLLFFSWTRTGDVSEVSDFAVWNSSNFTGIVIEWKSKKRLRRTLARCKTDADAKALAKRLGISLGMPSNASYPRGVKKSAR